MPSENFKLHWKTLGGIEQTYRKSGEKVGNENLSDLEAGKLSKSLLNTEILGPYIKTFTNILLGIGIVSF